MYLTAGTLLPYLLQKGIVSAAALVGGRWHVVQPDPGRPVLAAVTPAGRGWVVKQASPLDRDPIAMLGREAALYRLGATARWARPLGALQPRLALHDPGVHALVLEYLPHDTGLDRLRRESVQPAAFGAVVGRALAAVHVPLAAAGLPGELLAPRLPWVLRSGVADHPDMHRPAVRRMVELLRAEAGLAAPLAALARDWRDEALVHCDAKLDNLLVADRPQPRAWLVDWAYAGIGDPAWDAGTMLHSALVAWLHGIPFRRDRPFADSLGEATLPLALVREFAGALLGAYAAARRLRGAAGRAFAPRAFAYAGAALAQTAVAVARTHPEPTPRQLALLQAAANILADPAAAARELGDIR